MGEGVGRWRIRKLIFKSSKMKVALMFQFCHTNVSLVAIFYVSFSSMHESKIEKSNYCVIKMQKIQFW